VSLRRRSLAFVDVCVLLLATGAWAQNHNGNSSSAPVQAAAPPAYTLNILVSGPMGVVHYADDSVDILVPSVEGHTYIYVKGVDDCLAPTGPGNYQINAQAFGGKTELDPNRAVMHKELLVSHPSEPVQIDPNRLAFARIHLPKPWQIKPMHMEPARVQDSPAVPAPDTSWSYPAALAFRYAYSHFPSVTVSDLNNQGATLCTPRLESLGHEVILNVGMGPDAEDGTHQHAHAAFAALLNLFPPLTRYIAFPSTFAAAASPATTSGGANLVRISSGHGRLLPVIHATDCRAPMILVTGAPHSAATTHTIALNQRKVRGSEPSALFKTTAVLLDDFQAEAPARGLCGRR